MRSDVLIMDGRHLLWRSSDAFSDLSAEVDGEEIGTGGVYGFLAILLRVFNRYRARVEVAWEGKTNFRKRIFPGYKAKPEPDEDAVDFISDMVQQEARLIELLTAMGVQQFRGDDHEADDVIGTRAAFHSGEGRSVIIYSGDSDLRQLVGPEVCCVSPTTQGRGKGQDVVYTPEKVEERHAVPPKLLAQLKAMAGDSSDKIPGAPGIGPKTAAQALNHYGSLKEVLKAARSDSSDWPGTPRQKRIIAEHVRDILLYYKLTRIRTNAPMIEIPPERSQKRTLELLTQYKFRSLASPAELHSLMKMGQARNDS